MKNIEKVAVVTGAGSGIGRELILQLADQGYSIATVDINETQLVEAGKRGNVSSRVCS